MPRARRANHDRGAASLARDAAAALIEEALGLVRVSSAVFLRGEFSAPWGFTSVGPKEYVALLAPRADRVILFHIALEGRFHIRVDSGQEAVVSAGEAVVLPYSDRHVMGFPPSAEAVPVGRLLPPRPWMTMPVMRMDGGGVPTRILCGYLHCEDFLFHPVLRALPPLIHVRPRQGPAADWLRASAAYAVAKNIPPGRAGARLPELLLVDSLRQTVEDLPPARTGWLAALRDPIVGRALSLLHEQPAKGWSVEMLARSIGVSRSVLGERFAATLGAPPMRYLLQWRLQLAAHLLRSTTSTLPEIAERVGYASEAAFNRAFKRGLGRPPGAWRARASLDQVRTGGLSASRGDSNGG